MDKDVGRSLNDSEDNFGYKFLTFMKYLQYPKNKQL